MVVVSYDHLGDSKSAHDVLSNELCDVFILDVSISFGLYPFVEVISGNK